MNARALICQSAMVYCASKPVEISRVFWIIYIKAIDHKFLWFRDMINHLGCWKNTRRIRKSFACGSWFTNSSRVLPTSRVVYQPINHKNLVVYCLIIRRRFRSKYLRIFVNFTEFLKNDNKHCPAVLQHYCQNACRNHGTKIQKTMENSVFALNTYFRNW